MAVLVNFKICDNAKECGGIAVCPTGALSWNEEKKSIQIDNDKCISCGLCEKECPIGAFTVAKNEEEYAKAKKEIDEDPRTTKDLFVDRYGAVAISDFFKIDLKEIKDKSEKDCLTLIELTKNLPKDTLFYKAESDKIIEKFHIRELPSLLIFKKGELLGHIDGYYTTDEKETMLSQLNEIIK